MRVEILTNNSVFNLEENINSWLELNQNYKIIDIKYSSFIRNFEHKETHSAMIIYEKRSKA